jgi:hypothetical protein
MKKDTTEFIIELQELDVYEAIDFAEKLIEEAESVKLSIKCTHILKGYDMNEIANMYQRKLIKMYKKQKRGIEKLHYVDEKPLTFRNMSKSIKGFDVTDFSKYIQNEKNIMDDNAENRYAENIAHEVEMPFEN